MKLKLSEAIASPQDLQALVHELRNYTRWYGANWVKKQAHAKHPAPDQPELTTAAKAVLHDWLENNPLTRTSLDRLIAQLEHYLREANVMTITLAAPPSGGIKKQLTAWCRENISPGILVSYEFNQALLGGMVVRYSSHIYDWSFRRQILEQRANFPGVLRNV